LLQFLYIIISTNSLIITIIKMSIHYGNNEYYHLVGKVLIDQNNVCRVIQGLQEEHDSVYRFTDGIAGNAYRVYLMVAGSDEMESLHFRHFKEVVRKYGELQRGKPQASLTVKVPTAKIQKWAKIHPEKLEPSTVITLEDL